MHACDVVCVHGLTTVIHEFLMSLKNVLYQLVSDRCVTLQCYSKETRSSSRKSENVMFFMMTATFDKFRHLISGILFILQAVFLCSWKSKNLLIHFWKTCWKDLIPACRYMEVCLMEINWSIKDKYWSKVVKKCLQIKVSTIDLRRAKIW